MIEETHPLLQTLLGTLFTWGFTALGAALVFVFNSGQRKILDGSLGFAAGVMTAASYWSLLAPAIEMAEASGNYGDKGQWAFVPVAVGFTLGAVFVYGADLIMPENMLMNPANQLAVSVEDHSKQHDGESILLSVSEDYPVAASGRLTGADARRRGVASSAVDTSFMERSNQMDSPQRSTGHGSDKDVSWRRILLLIIAITIHNIPEGLAVGVGFGAVGKTKAATFENARNLALGIGIQNFPEGMAVSLPLRASGMSTWKSFWYGQLSGMVEPVAGLLGAMAVYVAEPILPYALAFAAGAMIFVVVDDIVPEAQTCGNGKIASWGAIVGFVVMMSLDVGLG